MWKKHKIVMLPTEKASGICTDKRSDSHPKLLNYHIPNWQDEKGTKEGYTKNYNLYILSDEEIKEGDWYVNDISGNRALFKADSVFNEGNNPNIIDKREHVYPYKNYRVIATTDVLPIEWRDYKGDLHGQNLAFISQSFIHSYIQEYNKGNIITEVEVEYDEIEYLGSVFNGQSLTKMYSDNPKLKINLSNNTINIKMGKDNWNREEVAQLMKLAYNEGYSTEGEVIDIEEWINTHLI